MRGVEGVRGLSKQEKGLVAMDNSVRGEGSKRRLNGNGENTIIIFKK